MDIMPPPSPGHFDRTVHYFHVRVYFEDTDLSGVVYHANYLRYMERARSDMLRIADIDQRQAHEGGEGVYAVAEVAVKYRAPAHLDDDLVVVSRIEDVGAAHVRLRQDVMRDDVLVSEGHVVVAFLGANGRPKRQPKAWLQIFQSIKAGKSETP